MGTSRNIFVKATLSYLVANYLQNEIVLRISAATQLIIVPVVAQLVTCLSCFKHLGHVAV